MDDPELDLITQVLLRSSEYLQSISSLLVQESGEIESSEEVNAILRGIQEISYHVVELYYSCDEEMPEEEPDQEENLDPFIFHQIHQIQTKVDLLNHQLFQKHAQERKQKWQMIQPVPNSFASRKKVLLIDKDEEETEEDRDHWSEGIFDSVYYRNKTKSY